MKYELLNKPFKIGNVELRNRFVMLPMTIEKTDNYHVGDDLVDFYEQRAKGGAALIELGSCYVCDVFDTHPKYHTTTGAVGVWDDCFIPGPLPVPLRFATSMAQSSLLSCSFATSGVQRVKTSFTPMPLLSTLLPAPSLVCLKRNSPRKKSSSL